MSFISRKYLATQSSPTAKPFARPYDRLAQLPRLIGLWPSEMQDFSAAGTTKILALLRKALRAERARGRAGHWTYDLNKHLALAESLKAERAHLRALEAKAVATRPAAKKAVRAPSPGTILRLPGNRAVMDRSAGRDIASPDQPVFLLPSLAESNS
jgi:hypothetical protein